MKRKSKIIYWVSTIWLALGMLSTAAAQVFPVNAESGFSTSLGYPPYFIILLGAAKVAGVVVIMAPKLLLLKEWAYAGFIFMMGGAVISHIAVHDEASQLFPSVLLLSLTLVSWYHRPVDRKLMLVNP